MAKKKKEHRSRKQKFLLRQATKDRLENVRLLVEKHLQRDQPSEYRWVTFPGAVLERDGLWYVQVLPVHPKASVTKQMGRLQKIEDEIARGEGFQVMLVSMLPMDYQLEHEMPVLWAFRD